MTNACPVPQKNLHADVLSEMLVIILEYLRNLEPAWPLSTVK